MKIFKIISCLLIFCCFGFVLGGCKDDKKQWVHITQYFRYLEDYPEYGIEMKVQNVSYDYTNLTNCYDGHFNTLFRHIEFRLHLKNNASGFSGYLLHLDDVDFKFNNDLTIYKMYMYLNEYTEDYTCFKIDADNSYIIYLRVLYKDLPNNQSLELENDYVLKLWNIRI